MGDGREFNYLFVSIELFLKKENFRKGCSTQFVTFLYNPALFPENYFYRNRTMIHA